MIEIGHEEVLHQFLAVWSFVRMIWIQTFFFV